MIIQLIKENALVILALIIGATFFLPTFLKWKRIHQVGFLVFLSILWLGLNRFNSLTTLQQLTKSTAPAPFLLLLAWTLRYPSTRKRNPIIYFYFLNAVLYIIAVSGADDAPVALIKASFWLLIILCSIKVTDSVNSGHESFVLLLWISGATALTTLITGSSLVVSPGTAFRAGLNRLYPYGANPNQIGVVFFATTVLSSAILLNSKRFLPRVFFACAIGASFVLAILTASRGVVFSTALGLLPYLAFSIKRITSLLILTLAGSAILYFAVDQIQESGISRLSSLESERFERWQTIFDRMNVRNWVIGQIGESSFDSESIEGTKGHSHNAFIKWIYLGGITALAPITIVTSAVALKGGRRVIRQRMGAISTSEFWFWYFYILSVAYGFVNESIFEPTNPLCFMHVLASVLILQRHSWDKPVQAFSHTMPSKHDVGGPRKI